MRMEGGFVEVIEDVELVMLVGLGRGISIGLF